MRYTATYSPEDNKLRLYPSGRLPADVYQRVKAAGFKWAPKQQLFVAPAWTPDRADLAATFAPWVKLGELPETALLARFVGSGACGNRGSSIDESTGARMGDEVNEMETLCHLTVTGKPDRWYMIFAPAPTT